MAEDNVPDQLRSVRTELGDLTLTVGRLVDIVASLRETVRQQPILPYSPEPALPPQPASPSRPKHLGVKAIDHVSMSWNSTEALAASMDIRVQYAHRKLYYLRRLGLVEYDNGHWRKKPAPEPAPKMKLKPNGLHKSGRRRHTPREGTHE